MRLEGPLVRKLVLVLSVSIGFTLVVVGGALLVSRVLSMSVAKAPTEPSRLLADRR